MKKFKIREAVEKDSESILNLIKELAAFEKEPDEVSLTIEELAKDGFGIKPKFKCFVAESKKKNSRDCIVLPLLFFMERCLLAFRGFNCYKII